MLCRILSSHKTQLCLNSLLRSENFHLHPTIGKNNWNKRKSFLNNEKLWFPIRFIVNMQSKSISLLTQRLARDFLSKPILCGNIRRVFVYSELSDNSAVSLQLALYWPAFLGTSDAHLRYSQKNNNFTFADSYYYFALNSYYWSGVLCKCICAFNNSSYAYVRRK